MSKYSGHYPAKHKRHGKSSSSKSSKSKSSKSKSSRSKSSCH